jgi:hypothetical protein
MFLFFSVARSQEIGSWERAAETAQSNGISAGANSSSNSGNTAAPVVKPPAKVAVPKSGVNPNFGMNMPMMVSAFDTAVWLKAAA